MIKEVQLQKRAGTNLRSLCCIIALLILMTITTSFFNKLGVGTMIRFVGYQIILVILPGVIVMTFFEVRNLSFIESILFSYIVGYSFNIFSYCISMLINRDEYLRWFSFIYTLLYLFASFLLIKGKSKMISFWNTESINKQEQIVLYSFLLIIFFVKLLAFSLSENSLYTFGSETYQRDYLTWVSDVSACKISMPPILFSDGVSIRKYHYLVAAQIACVSKLCGVTATVATSALSFIQSTIMLTFSGSLLVFKFARKTITRVGTILLLFFTTGIDSITFATYQWHLLVMPMGFDYGYSFFMSIMLLMVILFSEDVVDLKKNVLVVLLILTLTGVKGPSAASALLLILVCCICVSRARAWKERKRLISLFISSALVLGIMYTIMMRGAVTAFGTGTAEIVINKQGMHRFFEVLIKLMERVIDVINMVLLTAPFTIIIAVVYVLFRKKKCRDYLAEAMMIVYVSLAAITALVHMHGASQVYFIETAACIPPLIVAKATEECYELVRKRVFLYYTVIGACILVSLKIGYLNGLSAMINNSVSELFGVKSTFEKEYPVHVSQSKYNSFLFMNACSSEDMRTVLSADFHPQEFAALAERLTSGTIDDETIVSAFSGDEDAISIIDNRAEYLMIHSRFDTGGQPQSWENVYQNEEVRIIRTNKRKGESF